MIVGQGRGNDDGFAGRLATWRHSIYSAVRGLGAFLQRPGARGKGSGSAKPGSRSAASQEPTPHQKARQQLKLAKLANRKLARQQEEIAALQLRLARKGAGDADGGVRPENVVWIFGSGRTGSSWLSFMMRDLPDHTRWNEPLVGYLFGHTYYEWFRHRADDLTDRNFILGSDRHTWLNSIRRFVLDGATARFPERIDNGYLVIKEPHGSVGAPLLMEALPESRMIFLVRDPRDTVASALDAHRGGSWANRRVERKKPTAEEQSESLVGVKDRAQTYLRDMEAVKRAYEAHGGRKVLVRYEDLRADTLGTMRRIYSALEIPVDEAELAKSVEKHAWENIPESQKGPGKIRRKARPGGWREDLTAGQVEIVERITAPLLDEFYG
jgi:hypothetical protein